MTRTVVVFGSSGGIGEATIDAFNQAGYTVIPVDRHSVDFLHDSSSAEVEAILAQSNPDFVVNCVGYLDKSNFETYNNTFDINVGSNWSIIRYYMTITAQKPINIIMVGSSAYKSGRKDYILYAASKAALYNVWQGASEYFKGRDVIVGLVNPVRTRTKMADLTKSAICLEPYDVAQEILSMASSKSNQLVNMKYPEEN